MTFDRLRSRRSAFVHRADPTSVKKKRFFRVGHHRRRRARRRRRRRCGGQKWGLVIQIQRVV